MGYSQLQDFETSIKKFEESIEILRELKMFDLSMSSRIFNLGEAYRFSKNYEKAIQLFNESLKIK